jgi:molybdopterin-guanine dinucleotide biosynthesis protein A
MSAAAAGVRHADSAPPALYGLLLTGGRSSRMGRDKAALPYGQGAPQLERAMELLRRHVERAYVSVRADQQRDPLRARYPQIADSETHSGSGPIAGMLAAQAQHPEAAWLVLACDLPLLDDATLTHLVRRRDAARLATAYRSSHDGLPEPLCAIYEPRSRELLAAYVAAGKTCPRRFLGASDTLLLDEPNPRALDNVNTPQEYGAVSNGMSADMVGTPKAAVRHLKVQYFALLREQAGRREEALTSAARTPHELYAELAARYPFTLGSEMLRVAINGEFSDWGRPLREGDSVVFIPPVAGG